MQDEISLKSAHEYHPDALRPVTANRRMYYTVKRMADVILAILLLVILSPLMLVVGIVIYIYSPGPVFFSQERVGARRIRMDGKDYWKRENFRFHKFRTMHINVDAALHQKYVRALIANDQKQMAEIQGQETKTRKLVNDPRIIRPGKILRKFSLDELPQLWNVLCGDMSIIGPRPALPYEVEVYKNWHLQRLEAQPGITGLQQVTARCTADFDSQVLLDIEYISHQSLWLDTKILLKTPLAVFSTSGAL
jgi:lipopolysaccharide/colanic/teichoic acid biosynthesis glycosyltransferase